MCKQIINSSADETEQQLEQKWKNATIANNFIFYKVMQNNEDVCKELKDNYVIFICVPDIFERGLAKYTFENLCLENTEIKLNDRAYKYFFIASNYDKILDERQKAFLKLVMSPKATGTDSFTEKVTKLVEEAKLNTQWRKQFMEWEREMARKFREGKEEGELLKAIEAAVLIVNKYKATPESAASDVGAPLDKVLEALKTPKQSNQ